MKDGQADLLRNFADQLTPTVLREKRWPKDWIWGQLTAIGRMDEQSLRKRIQRQLTVVAQKAGPPSGCSVSRTDWKKPARLEDRRRTLALPCFAGKAWSVGRDLRPLLEVGGSQLAGAADAVAPQYLAVQVEVVSEAVLLLAVAGTDSAVVIQATAQMDLPLPVEMRVSPMALVVGSWCSVEANQSAAMVKMMTMVDDSETASFASKTDWFALERQFAEETFVQLVGLRIVLPAGCQRPSARTGYMARP
jgi:hypothetical protein